MVTLLSCSEAILPTTLSAAMGRSAISSLKLCCSRPGCVCNHPVQISKHFVRTCPSQWVPTPSVDAPASHHLEQWAINPGCEEKFAFAGESCSTTWSSPLWCQTPSDSAQRSVPVRGVPSGKTQRRCSLPWARMTCSQIPSAMMQP